MSILKSFKLTCDVASVFLLLFTPSSFVHEQPLSAIWFGSTARKFRFFATSLIHDWSLLHLIFISDGCRLERSFQYRWTFNSKVTSARLLCSSNLQNALLLLPVLNKASENWNLFKRLLDLIWQTADYLFTFYLLAFLSTYHRKQWDATQASLDVAGHLSTYHT